MNRRNFLLRSGMIAPAVLLLPDLVVADIQQDDADVMVVLGNSGKGDALAGDLRMAGKRVKEIRVVSISGIKWNGQRFLVNDKNGSWHSVKKLVFNTAYMIDRGRGVVVLPVSPAPVEIPFAEINGKRELPVFWTMGRGAAFQQYANGFMDSRQAAFMCIKG